MEKTRSQTTYMASLQEHSSTGIKKGRGASCPHPSTADATRLSDRGKDFFNFRRLKFLQRLCFNLSDPFTRD